jgi:hypothetical protein
VDANVSEQHTASIFIPEVCCFTSIRHHKNNIVFFILGKLTTIFQLPMFYNRDCKPFLGDGQLEGAYNL